MTIEELVKITNPNIITNTTGNGGANMVMYDTELNPENPAGEKFFLIRVGQYLGNIIRIKYNEDTKQFVFDVKLSSFFDLENDTEEICFDVVLSLYFYQSDRNFIQFAMDYTDEKGLFVPEKAIGESIAFDTGTYIKNNQVIYKITQLQWGM